MDCRKVTITTAAIDDFLRQMLGLASGRDLESAFRAQRRILMIEEGERIYLRKVGGFDGAQHLMNWIQRTASTTLWVLAMNDKAFRVLRAGTQFARIFSHRINAMSVSREDLENAILERHRLSGLRLEFLSPPSSDPRVGRVKSLLGLGDSPQKLFFDSLYQQSAGVFRSAFELWLSSIERVEGETLKIRQPLEPAFASLRGELAQLPRGIALAASDDWPRDSRRLGFLAVAPIAFSTFRFFLLLSFLHPGISTKSFATRSVTPWILLWLG